MKTRKEWEELAPIIKIHIDYCRKMGIEDNSFALFVDAVYLHHIGLLEYKYLTYFDKREKKSKENPE